MLGNLSNVQVELLKIYNTDLSEAELIELKNVLARFFADKSIASADKIWDKNSYSSDDMEKWLHEES